MGYVEDARIMGILTLEKKMKKSRVSMRDMLKAGVHFGRQTRFWNH